MDNGGKLGAIGLDAIADIIKGDDSNPFNQTKNLRKWHFKMIEPRPVKIECSDSYAEVEEETSLGPSVLLDPANPMYSCAVKNFNDSRGLDPVTPTSDIFKFKLKNLLDPAHKGKISLSLLFLDCTSQHIYKSQLEMIESIQLNRRTIIVKPRQIFGVDTAIICHLIEKALNSGWNSVIYCDSQDSVRSIDSLIRQMFKALNLRCPWLVFGKTGSLSIKCGVLPEESDSIDFCYFSEAAFIPNLEKLVLSIEPTLKPDGKIVMASTQNWGNPNLFSDILLPENEASDWNKIVLDWRDLHEVTGGDPGWGESKRLAMGLSQSDWDKEYEPIVQFN